MTVDTAGQPAFPRDDALIPLLADWLPRQRWFAGGATEVAGLAVLSRVPLPLAGDAVAEHLLVQVAGTVRPAIYQLFLGWQPGDVPERLAHVVLGRIGGLTGYDALHDGALQELLLSVLAGRSEVAGLSGAPETDAGAVLAAAGPGHVLAAEQSNTSLVYGDSVIVKLFRRIEPGTNPDVTIHRVLAAAGSAHIAQPLAELVAPAPDTPTTMAFATRFFANSADGWAMATASVRDLLAERDLHADEVGGDFAAESQRLGGAIGEVHRDLAATLGHGTLTADQTGRLLDAMSAAATETAGWVPSLAAHLPGIHAVYAAATPAAGQLVVHRIHGDLHLGQVLRTLSGWAVIDFEGEPSRPLAERVQPQSPLQDVAGMMRSFDYAAHQHLPGDDKQLAYRAAEWSQRNRGAFCDGYAAVTGQDPRDSGPVLRAFELAKAVYEVGYEHAHRPAWEAIPLGAVIELIREGTA